MRQTSLSKTFISSGSMCYLSRCHRNMYFISLLRKWHLFAKPQTQHPDGRSWENTQTQKPRCSLPLGTQTVCGQCSMFGKPPIAKAFLSQWCYPVFPQNSPCVEANSWNLEWPIPCPSFQFPGKGGGRHARGSCLSPFVPDTGEHQISGDNLRLCLWASQCATGPLLPLSFFLAGVCLNPFTWICCFAGISMEITNPEHWTQSPHESTKWQCGPI